MATRLISRAFLLAPRTEPSFSLSKSLRFSPLLPIPSSPNYTKTTPISSSATPSFSLFRSLLPSKSSLSHLHNRSFTSSESPKKINTKVNFSLSDSEEEGEENPKNPPKEIDKSKLPPPYDPFNKKPVIEEPEDPQDLQQVFHKMRSDGLLNNAVKMFDELSEDGLTHEALELFAQIKDKGHMPDVVAHTAVIEAYANAGQAKEALKVFLRMLASGVAPNAYTYSILIKGLAGNTKFLGEAKKYVVEMMDKGMKPNAGVYTAVFEALAREEKSGEGREFLKQMKAKGFVPDEKAVREALKSKRGPVSRSVMDILFAK
ncbi:hypothetical protein UlMin_012889 [Ulmus minor]